MDVRNSMVLVPKAKPVALACKRLIAWSLEVGLVLVSAGIPWGLGHYLLTADQKAIFTPETVAIDPNTNEATRENSLVRLNPVLETTQQIWASIAQIPPHQLYRWVPRWTDTLWTVAFVLPFGVAGIQVIQLIQCGRTWPKRWLKIQVFSLVGGQLTLRQIAARELLRWGLPLGLVGGVALLTGASFGLWTPAVIGLLAMLEGCSAIAPDNRAWHDRIAGTRVALTPDREAALLTQVSHPNLDNVSVTALGEVIAPNQLQLYGENVDDDDWWLTEADGNLTSLVLAPRKGLIETLPPSQLVLAKSLVPGRWIWWLLTTGLVIAGGIGFFAGRATRLSASPQSSDDIFLETVQDLIDNNQRDNEAAILMMAQVNDPRTVYYLADLLTQTTHPENLITLQQALISKGLESIPSLLALSHGFEIDLQQPLDEATRQTRLAQRHIVQGAISKLLAIHSNQLDGTNLNRINLSLYQDNERTFRLIQPGLLAAGTSWQSANLYQANLAQASFFDVGPDGKSNSYDDVISDLSGVNLTAASLEDINLQGAQLVNATLKQANLTNANLTYSNLEDTQLSKARLMHANATKSRWQGSNLVGADLTQAIFDQAKMPQARLNRVNASHSRWISADLSESHWVGANLMGADFSQATLAYANFQGADLDGVNFSQADLRQANLREADLQHINLTGAKLTDVDFAGAIFEDSSSLTGSFITPNAQLGPKHLKGVNFSRARNLDERQITYICAQGGVHPACISEQSD